MRFISDDTALDLYEQRCLELVQAESDLEAAYAADAAGKTKTLVVARAQAHHARVHAAQRHLEEMLCEILSYHRPGGQVTDE